MTGIPENFDEYRRKSISEKTIKDPSEKQREILKLINDLKGNDEWNALNEMGIKGLEGRFAPMVTLFLGAIGAYVSRNKEPPAETFVFHSGAAGDQMFLFL
ncbi:unnamed protein product [Sphagnum balticum]